MSSSKLLVLSLPLFFIVFFTSRAGFANSTPQSSSDQPQPAASYRLTVTNSGNGSGTITSTPAGIRCPSTCSADFAAGTQVTLTAVPGPNSYLASWGDTCTGTNHCVVTLNSAQSVSSIMNVWPINHIIFMAQENRSFDHYFGAMRAYWAANGYPDQSFDGLSQFNPQPGPGVQPPFYGAPPTNPGCAPSNPPISVGVPFSDCTVNNYSPTVTSFHFITQCQETQSPAWDPAHYNLDWANPYFNPLDNPPMNGFVSVSAHEAHIYHLHDLEGMRVMGYYDADDLNYYYFMATNFATSDRFFNPAMTDTDATRHYLVAATSQGATAPVGHRKQDGKLTATTIFQELQAAGISWKIYVNPEGTPCTPPYQTSCLMTYDDLYMKNFVWGKQNMNYPKNIGTIGPAGTCGSSPCDFENDLANGTLPQVVEIEPASPASLDEHASDNDGYKVNIQAGAAYVSGLINSLMQSSSWNDSVFFLTYDEGGGYYDHVPPQPEPSPDGIKPQDLLRSDVCALGIGPTCDFTWTGQRIPLIVVSPYTRENYVSHTVMDYTAILNFIEARFGLSALTARDAAQPSMSEFFDFTSPPWLTPPNPPVQNRSKECYLDHLP